MNLGFEVETRRLIDDARASNQWTRFNIFSARCFQMRIASNASGTFFEGPNTTYMGALQRFEVLHDSARTSSSTGTHIQHVCRTERRCARPASERREIVKT